MMELVKDLHNGVIGFIATAKVTKRDYETVLIPAVEAAFRENRKIRLYYQIGPGLSGFEPGAMLDDFLVGMRHLIQWERVAVVTDVEWIAHAARAFAFLLPGKVKIFDLTEAKQARAWLAET